MRWCRVFARGNRLAALRHRDNRLEKEVATRPPQRKTKRGRDGRANKVRSATLHRNAGCGSRAEKLITIISGLVYFRNPIGRTVKRMAVRNAHRFFGNRWPRSSLDIEDLRYPSEFRYGFCSQLSHGVAAMHLHRDLADRKFARDLLVHQSGCDKRHHLPFARRQ